MRTITRTLIQGVFAGSRLFVAFVPCSFSSCACVCVCVCLLLLGFVLCFFVVFFLRVFFFSCRFLLTCSACLLFSFFRAVAGSDLGFRGPVALGSYMSRYERCSYCDSCRTV